MAEAFRDQTALVKVIGARMKQARELCCLSQTAAALKLGYKNSSKLAKIERASDTHSVPLWLLLRASDVYEVTTDFLLGRTDDWEFSARKMQERLVSPWLWVFVKRASSREMEMLGKLNDRLQKITDTVIPLADAVMELAQATEQFRRANPWFDREAVFGAKFVGRMQRAENLALKGKQSLHRFEMECRLASADDGSQLPLQLDATHDDE